MIYRFIKQFTDNEEKKLAIKISMASFLIFISILTCIISTSYIYQNREIRKELRIESNMLDINPEIGELMKNEIEGKGNGMKKLGGRGRGPKEIIILDANKNIIKNDFLELDSNLISLLYSINEKEIKIIKIYSSQYILTKKTISGNTLFFFRDLTPLNSFHITLISIALFGSLIGLAIIYLLARYLARITIEPIREQSKELEAYSHNVAHELRTPLSIMRSNLELLRIKPEERFIKSTDEEITGMENIIESLLFLAKPSESNIQKELNITKKTEEIIEKYKHENEILFIHDKKNVFKKSSEELYSRILCNLIENAIKYKSDGDIKIELTKNSIKISNTIDKNLNNDDIKNITKAFHQGDQSRNSSGYGLGLALVTKIVEISGWIMSISTVNKKFIVEIHF